MNATNRQLWRLNELGFLTLFTPTDGSPGMLNPIGREEAKQALSQALDQPSTEQPEPELSQDI